MQLIWSEIWIAQEPDRLKITDEKGVAYYLIVVSDHAQNVAKKKLVSSIVYCLGSIQALREALTIR